MKFLCAAFLLSALAVATSSQAQRPLVPIVNHDNLPVATAAGKPVTVEGVRQAIVDGAGAGKRKWTVAQVAGAPKLLATYNVRTHSITVEIEYSATSYSVRYSGSTNMKYQMLNGVPVIHPFYNDWVRELIESIRREMMKA